MKKIMNIKIISYKIVMAYIMSILVGCRSIPFLSKKTLIQEEIVTTSKKYLIQSYITNTISDPTYAQLYINKNENFRCRGASKIKFTIENNTLIIYTDGNLQYEYDHIQKKSYGELKIMYFDM